MPRAAVDGKQKVVAEFRRSEILAAATKVFATKGFVATRMEDIAKAARLAKGTLYLYFQSKDANKEPMADLIPQHLNCTNRREIPTKACVCRIDTFR
jgi:AcrR family transcriptional regulator